MPTFTIKPAFSIEKINEEQAFIGTLKSDQVYEIYLNYDSDDPKLNATGMIHCSIKSVSNITDTDGNIVDYKITPAIMFYHNGFKEVDETNDTYHSFLLSEVISITEVWAKRYSLKRRPESTAKDPFSFRFISAKTKAPFTVKVDPTHFVGISAIAKSGAYNTHFGYIDFDYYNDPELNNKGLLKMKTIAAIQGVFTVNESYIPVSAIKGIFFYKYDFISMEERAKEIKEKRKAKEEDNVNDTGVASNTEIVDKEEE